jgi:beta-lactam-binding protein with PASTA domain
MTLWESIKVKLKFYSRELWLFIKTFAFWKSFAGIVVMIVGIFSLIFWLLKCYTHHGESLHVDKYINMRVQDAVASAERRSFEVEISDSVYRQGVPPGIVIDQTPKPHSSVKENRTVYLTITRFTPDLVKLPEVFSGGNDDYYLYSRKLAALGVTCRIAERRLDTKLAEGTILAVSHKGKDITEELSKGYKVEIGSTIDFVVTETTNDQRTVPDLVCSTVGAAEFLLQSSGLTIGEIVPRGDVTNRAEAFIWKQDPAHDGTTVVRSGEQVTLYIQQEKPEECPD